MINALIEIGRGLREDSPMPLVEIPYPSQISKKEPKVIVVDLMSSIDENALSVGEIHIEAYTPENSIKKYFFRTPTSPQGPAASLSFKLPGKPSALRQRLGILNVLNYNVNVEKIANIIESKLNEWEKTGELQKNAPKLIVLRIDGKWPAENERLRESFVTNFLDFLGNYKKKPIWKTYGLCHGCGKETMVYGGIGNLLKFYTVDKYGYAPSLNPKIAWKQYALCEDCIFDLERGKRAVEEFLTWRFYGKEFWLLPVSTGDIRKILERFKLFHAEFSGKAYKGGYESLEDKLLYEASIQEEALSYHFVFVKSEQQALRILLHIDEVLPSLLSKYVAIKTKTEKRFNDFVYEVSAPKNKTYFTFFSSPSLRATNQKPGFTDEDFYLLVDKVFRRSQIDEKYLIAKAMSRISKDMAKAVEQSGIPWWSVLETLLSLEFLLKWGILKRKIGGIDMSGLPYEEFFEVHGDFFNHPAKRALVLLGVLIQKFLNYQYNQRGSTPFLKLLKNLRLDQKDVKKIYVALQNKMNEYGKGHWWPELREGVSLYFVKAGDTWPLSPDEIGFYIAVGMSLHLHSMFRENLETEK